MTTSDESRDPLLDTGELQVHEGEALPAREAMSLLSTGSSSLLSGYEDLSDSGESPSATGTAATASGTATQAGETADDASTTAGSDADGSSSETTSVTEADREETFHQSDSAIAES